MSPGNILFQYLPFFLKIYIITVHPAGTSDRSDICEGSKFVQTEISTLGIYEINYIWNHV